MNIPQLKNFFIKSFFSHLLFFLLFICLVLAIRFKPIAQSFELDYDEGFNLIKALLYSQGFALYSQIWNDQPPLFTVLLSHWLNLFGQSVFAARLLVLLFSGLLIWCFFQIIRRQLGTIPAVVATLLLFTSWMYIRLSISVMIGVPSLCLAMLSIYFLTLYKENHRPVFLAFSGSLLALSLQTKLFTVFLAPLMLFYLIDFRISNLANKPQRKLFYSILFWLGSFSIIYIFIALFYHQLGNNDQIIQSHLHQPANELANFHNINYLIFDILRQDYDYVFLAFIGICAIFSQKQRDGIFPLTWLGSATLILLLHKPIWYHHYLLLAIPVCWLAAYGVALLLDLFSKNIKPPNIKKLILPGLIVIVLIVLVIATPPNSRGTPTKNPQLMQLVLKHKYSTKWMFTDRPIYAFYAGLRVPPEIAIMSYKRFNSGDLTSQELLTVLENYRPEQILLARWTTQIKSDIHLMAYINKNYSKTYTNEKGTEEHYILDLLQK